MKQRIIVTGFGGQGVIFITKLLAEIALLKDLSVFVSETHGMAQRGGNVISHMKIFHKGEAVFWSPLIKEGQADLMISLHKDALDPYWHFLKRDATVILNASNVDKVIEDTASKDQIKVINFDATSIATEMGNPVMANLILTAYAVSRGLLFCTIEELRKTIKIMEGGKESQRIAFIDKIL